MLLMLKNIPVLMYDSEEYKLVIYREDLLPFCLRDVFKISQTRTDIDYLNIQKINDFLRNRTLPLSRANSKIIYNMLHCSQNDRLEIAVLCRGITLSDNYWIKSDDEKIQWEDVSLRTNPLNEIFTEVALCGRIITLQGSMHTPETTTNGVSAKGWKRENDNLYLYKCDPRAKREVIASNILDILGFSHVVYTDAEYDGRYCCKCACLTSDTYSIVSAEDLSNWLDRSRKDVVEFACTVDMKHFSEMCIADYLLANIDRHKGNWGFYYESDTCNILGLHPLYDHDHTFISEAYANPNMEYTPIPGYSMQYAALEAKEHITICPSRDFTPDDFLDQSHYDCFMRRLEEFI